MSTRLYQFIVFISALTGALVVVALDAPVGSVDYLEAALICALVALGRSFEFRISATSSSHLGTPALLAGAMILDPPVALLAVGFGVALHEARRRDKFATLFNVGQALAQTLVALGVLRLAHWKATDPGITDPPHVGFALLAGCLAIGASVVLVALRNHVACGGALRDAIWSVLGQGDREVYLLDISKIAIGLLLALLVDSTPLFIAFLLVPVVTMSRAIVRGGQLSKQLEIALGETEDSLAEAQRLAKLGSWEWELASPSMSWSDQLYDILGITPGAAPPTLNDIRRMLPLADRGKIEQLIIQARQSRSSLEFDHEIIHADGDLRYVSHRVTWVGADARAGERLVGTMHDITERKRLELRLRYQAYHDGLTGLPNREYFLDQLQECLATSRCRAVIFVDLDYFKTVNDTYGHEAGDAVLIEVGRRLRRTVGSGDFVARLSGDEFTILAGTHGDPGRVERLAAEVLRALRAPVMIDGASIQIAASAGLVYVAPHHESPSDLLGEADKALYTAKGDGRDRVSIRTTPDALPASA